MPPRTAEPSPLPEGLVYREEFITVEEERMLLDLLDVLDFQPVVMRGRTARRSVRIRPRVLVPEEGARSRRPAPRADALAARSPARSS